MIIECGEMITISIVYILYTKLKQIVYQCINYVQGWKLTLARSPEAS